MFIVEIINTQGQVVARGFGQNARKDLDFDAFAGADAFSDNKNSRRQGGAIFNAINDAQNQIMSPGFGTPVR